MFKVSNRNTRKRCLLISKLTLKTSERSHLTTSYLLEVTVQDHILDSFSIQVFLDYIEYISILVLLSNSTARNFSNLCIPIYIISWEIRNHYRNIWFMKNSRCQHFLFLEKQPQKWTAFSTFCLIFKGPPFHSHKVRHTIFP